MKMPFGKHAGKAVNDVPLHYLLWLHGRGIKHPRLRDEVERVLGITKKKPDVDVAQLRFENERLRMQVEQLAEQLADVVVNSGGGDELAERFPKWYREASLLAHPDRGGSTEMMQKINELKDMVGARA